MQKRWVGKSVNLDLLSDSLEEFFKDKGFLTKRTESKGERTIFWAFGRIIRNPSQAPRAKIIGDSNDFTIEIIASGLTTQPIRFGLLTKTLGGGYIVLKSIKVREELEKLEKEFWIYMEDKVAILTESAKHS